MRERILSLGRRDYEGACQFEVMASRSLFVDYRQLFRGPGVAIRLERKATQALGVLYCGLQGRSFIQLMT